MDTIIYLIYAGPKSAHIKKLSISIHWLKTKLTLRWIFITSTRATILKNLEEGKNIVFLII